MVSVRLSFSEWMILRLGTPERPNQPARSSQRGENSYSEMSHVQGRHYYGWLREQACFLQAKLEHDPRPQAWRPGRCAGSCNARNYRIAQQAESATHGSGLACYKLLWSAPGHATNLTLSQILRDRRKTLVSGRTGRNTQEAAVHLRTGPNTAMRTWMTGVVEQP